MLTEVLLAGSLLGLNCATGPTACKLIRGDVNEDSSLDISDLTKLSGWLYSGGSAPCNEDSADVNDDGDVDGSDYVYLAAYLYSGGPAPPAPFSSLGFDCTADDIENCCSPSGEVAAYATSGSHIKTVCPPEGLTFEWEGLGTDSFSGDTYRIRRANNDDDAHCDNHDPCNIWEFDWNVEGGEEFTLNELTNGTVYIELEIEVTATFDVDEEFECTLGCDEKDTIYVDLEPTSIRVGLEPAGGGTEVVLTLDDSVGTNISYEYEMVTVGETCEFQANSDEVQTDGTGEMDVTGDVLDALDTASAGNCDEYVVTSIYVDDLQIWANLTGGDNENVSVGEGVDVDLECSVKVEPVSVW